jgi:hypothetical protein
MIYQDKFLYGGISTPNLDNVPDAYRDTVKRLFLRWSSVYARNYELYQYYTMKSQLKSIGLDITPAMPNLNTVVGWCSKAVRAHSMRSVFDGFVFGGQQNATLDAVVRTNRMRSIYQQAWSSALVYGISAVTVMRSVDANNPVKVRVFSANQFCTEWDTAADGVTNGVFLTSVDDKGAPDQYTVHMPHTVLTLDRVDANTWSCTEEHHPMNRPLFDVFVNDPDPDRPLGHSLITPELMGIVDKAMRDVANMEIGAALFTYPQRYILGAAEGLFGDSVSDDDDEEGEGDEDEKKDKPSTAASRFKLYTGAIMAISRDENGEIPQVGQFAAGNAENFTRVFENDAQRFSGATNVPLAQLGVLSNTYTSSDALGAANDPLILEVETANRRNAEVLENIARMIMAVANNKALDELTDEQNSVQAYMQDPSMPTIAARADAWTKMSAADKSIVGTRVYYEGIGLSQPTIDRLRAEQRQAGALDMLSAIAAKMEG